VRPQPPRRAYSARALRFMYTIRYLGHRSVCPCPTSSRRTIRPEAFRDKSRWIKDVRLIWVLNADYLLCSAEM
jgi:hypothetical protein